jgi:hypothetical protein
MVRSAPSRVSNHEASGEGPTNHLHADDELAKLHHYRTRHHVIVRPDLNSSFAAFPGRAYARPAPPARKDKRAAQLFGMDTEPVAAAELPEKWHQVQTAMTQDFAVVAQCHANRTCPVAA